MDRRRFVTCGAGAIGAASIGACVAPRARLRTERLPAAALPGPLDAVGFHAARRFADTSFGRIAYVERGTGRAALFLHGYPLNGFQWRGALDRLSAHRRCIAADFMGMGYSETPEGQSVAPGAQAAMLSALLDKLSIDKVDVIGSDSGGAIAQLFVTRYPARVRTLMLTNCDAQNDSPPPSFIPLIAAAHAGTLADGISRQLTNKALARSPKGIGGQAYTYPDHPTDEAIDYYFTPLVSSPLRRAQFHAFAIGLEHNPLEGIEPLLRRCAAPARILWGTGDTVFSLASADWLNRAFGNSRGVRLVDGAKLFFPEEMPDVIAEEAVRLWG